MQLWKLGCRWGKGTPLFYDFINDESIVIGWIEKDYAIGDWLLITDGYTVLSIAEILQKGENVLKYPQYESIFDELEIPYDENIFIYKANHIRLKTEDQFSYPLQQGIVRVRKPEYITKFNHLKQKYMIPNTDIIEILKNKKQIILQGAPGTGKTYIAKDIAEILIFGTLSEDKKLQAERLKTSEQFKLVQFHPSYTYEDFVRGIIVETNSGSPSYKSDNKILGKFAKAALENWDDSKKSPNVLSKEKWVEKNLNTFKEILQNKIDDKQVVDLKQGKTPVITAIEEDSFRCNRYNNPQDSVLLKDKDIIHGYIGLHMEKPAMKIKDNPNLSKSARSGMYYLYQNLINLFNEYLEKEGIYYADSEVNKQLPAEKNYVLIIDEINRANLPSVLGELIYSLEYRGEKVESMYAVDGDNGLIIPPNLYIIGTMNTADRSVGQIDYAIRRRFGFVDMLPKVLTDPGFDIDLFKKVSAFFIKNVDNYVIDPENTSLEKSEFLSDEFLPEDVWIGHSYFIMDDHNRDIRLNYEIKPLLREYLKDGILKDGVEGGKTKKLINSL